MARPLFLTLGGAAMSLALLFCMNATALAASDIGKVIAFASGASVQREGKTEPLALHAGIRVSDTIQTDAAGRVKILFNDDSSVSLGPNTTMDMNEYADSGDKPAFAVTMPQGMIRAITGTIVDKNPEGFKMSSPEATVGIRGTIVTMHVERGQEGRVRTKVFVENTRRRVYVNNENVPSGNKWIREDGASRQERITPEDRRHIGRELAFRGGQGSAAAAPEAGEGRGRRAATEQLVAAGRSIVPQDASLKDDAQVAQTLSATNLLAAPLGHVSGTLGASTGGWALSGDFSFDVNLFSGAIANGAMNLSGYSGGGFEGNVFALGGGQGTAGASGFDMNATGTHYYNGTFQSSARGAVTGNVNLLTAPSGQSFPVDYGVGYSTPTDAYGTGTGAITK